MTQEEKQLLLVDLCSRLPYGVICQMEDKLIINDSPFYDYTLSERHIDLFRNHKDFYIKPYLRPMSSMTDEEKDEMFGICTLSNCSVNSNWEFVSVEIMSSHPRYGDHYSTDYSVIDWLNKNMFDYRGLIEKGLALEAPDGMYNIKEHNKI